jgi:hypothetical protein
LPISFCHQFAGACDNALQQYEAPVFHVGIPWHVVQVVEQLLYAVIALMLQLPISILCNEVYIICQWDAGECLYGLSAL